MHIFSDHQKKQIEVIDRIEQQVRTNTIQFSTVDPVSDFKNDDRLALTIVHLPHESLIKQIQQEIIEPLKAIEPHQFYYPQDSFHMTIKSIKTAENPALFDSQTIKKAEKVFEEIIPEHKKFQVYFYRLLLFPLNIALIGTTDEELDTIALTLDEKLAKKGIPDNKQYANSRYFFSNITLARFYHPVSERFIKKVEEISHSIKFASYTMDSVTLLTCNSVLQKKTILKTWQLQ